MYQTLYEEVVRFASEGDLAPELKRAKEEFVLRTGEMFETDPSFERRIAAFLEWYVLDRKISFNPVATPMELYVLARGEGYPEADRARLHGLSRTVLSLFEFRGAKAGDHLVMVDLLTNKKLSIYERRRPAGLESGDILEGRIVPYDDKLLFADAYYVHPRDARKSILKASKRFRKQKEQVVSRIDLVHRVAYLANRCERYKHVDPKQIFADLEKTEKAA
jgi:hypothetical protein